MRCARVGTRANTSASIRRSCTPTSAASMRWSARKVSRSAGPGPAPTMWTIPCELLASTVIAARPAMKHQLLHGPPAHQMLVDDAIHVGRRDVVVPDAVGLDAQHRPALAGGKAIDAAAFDPQRALVWAGGLELVAQAVEQGLGFAVLGAARPGTDEQMAAVAADLGLHHLRHDSTSLATSAPGGCSARACAM